MTFAQKCQKCFLKLKLSSSKCAFQSRQNQNGTTPVLMAKGGRKGGMKKKKKRGRKGGRKGGLKGGVGTSVRSR